MGEILAVYRKQTDDCCERGVMERWEQTIRVALSKEREASDATLASRDAEIARLRRAVEAMRARRDEWRKEAFELCWKKERAEARVAELDGALDVAYSSLVGMRGDRIFAELPASWRKTIDKLLTLLTTPAAERVVPCRGEGPCKWCDEPAPAPMLVPIEAPLVPATVQHDGTAERSGEGEPTLAREAGRERDIDECPACGAWVPDFNDPVQREGALGECPECNATLVVCIADGRVWTEVQADNDEPQRDRCPTECDKGSRCTLDAGHDGGHHTEHDCICYDPAPSREEGGGGHG